MSIALPECVIQKAVNAFHEAAGTSLHKDALLCSTGVRAAIEAVAGDIVLVAMDHPKTLDWWPSPPRHLTVPSGGQDGST